MSIKIKDVTFEFVDGLIITAFEDGENNSSELDNIIKSTTFKGKEGEIFYITELNEKVKYKIFVGLGKKELLNGEVLRNAMAKAAKKAKELKIEKIGVEFFETNKICVGGRIKGITEGMRLALYSFDKYKEQKSTYSPEIYISGVPTQKIEKARERLEEVNNLVDGVIRARDLINEPANTIYPESLAHEAIKIGAECGFEVQVFDEKECKDLEMKAFLSVGMGSSKSPRLIVMRYMGDDESSEVLGFVGKGLTYDSGGYSLKPSNSMVGMNGDMGGAAVVIGTMAAIAKNKLKKNVVAVVAACENLVSGVAYKPGDIIGSMAGKTIEVLNTDAEGRLTLIDAITYIIEKEGATKVIDLATLTGAAIVALGNYTTALMSNDEDFYDEFMRAADVTDEIFWRMPTFKHYRKQILGEKADLKNVDPNGAGTIVAGMFLKEFVQDKPWIHLDIAGTSDTKSPISEYIVKGGTGTPVRTLYYLAKGPCGCHKK